VDENKQASNRHNNKKQMLSPQPAFKEAL